MKSPFYFIVKPVNDRRYDNIKKFDDGFELITSSSKEDHTVSNRFAEVISTPKNYTGEIKPGDILLVHHNVFKYYNDMKGRERSGKSYISDNTFFVDTEQFFMYKSDGEWKTHGRFCFVKPVEKEDFYIKTPGKEQPLIGIVKYTNEELKKLDVNNGDRVLFAPESEYEFTVDGEKLYRMFTNNITMKWM